MSSGPVSRRALGVLLAVVILAGLARVWLGADAADVSLAPSILPVEDGQGSR